MDATMDRYADGDLAAFEQLYRAFAGVLFRYLCKLVGDASEAEDLLQITFLKLHRARSRWVHGSRIRPYLFAIAHNVAEDEIRSRSSSRRWLRLTGSGWLPDQPAFDGHGGGLVPRSRIEAAILALPDRQREAFVLMQWLGMTVKEAAHVAGATIPAMSLRALRARRRLRAELF